MIIQLSKLKEQLYFQKRLHPSPCMEISEIWGNVQPSMQDIGLV